MRTEKETKMKTNTNTVYMVPVPKTDEYRSILIVTDSLDEVLEVKDFGMLDCFNVCSVLNTFTGERFYCGQIISLTALKKKYNARTNLFFAGIK
jgi:hypothetical protein